MVTQVFGLDATGGVAVADISTDLTPQLGGDLELNGFNLLALAASGPSILDETTTSINPVVIPRRSDETTGVGSGGIGNLSLIANSTEVFDILSTDTVFNGSRLRGGVTNSWQLENVGSSATVPTLIHNRGSTTSGIGGVAGDTSLIVNGLEILRAEPTLVTFFQDMIATIANGPAILNEASANDNPTLIPNKADLSLGWGGQAGDITHTTSGFVITRFTSVGMEAENANGYQVRNNAAGLASPTLVPDRANSGSGIGGASAAVTLIVGGVERLNVNSTGLGFFATAPVAQQTGVAVTDVAIHAALVAYGLITA